MDSFGQHTVATIEEQYEEKDDRYKDTELYRRPHLYSRSVQWGGESVGGLAILRGAGMVPEDLHGETDKYTRQVRSMNDVNEFQCSK